MRSFTLSTILLFALGASAASATPASTSTLASASAYLTVDEALGLAFPDAQIERSSVFLDEGELDRASELAGEKLAQRIVHPYVARTPDGALLGTAYFDTHDVRTKRETVMVVVDAAARVRRIEVLAFAEPEDYLPRSKWYALFVGRSLDDELRVKRGIPNVTGATLTARATTNCVRRTLAVHEIVRGRPKALGAKSVAVGGAAHTASAGR